MKKSIQQMYFVFLALGVVGLLWYLIPYIWDLSSNVSYQFVLLFLLIILGSNLLARIAYKYVIS